MADGNRNMSWGDIMHLPDETRPEIIDGNPYQKSAVKRGHSFTHRRISAALDPATRRDVRDGWLITIEEDVQLTPSSYVRPDMAGWRLSRLAADTDEWPTTQLPDWVCEILSPNNASYDRGQKMAAYARAGLPWIWIADPDQRTVEVYQLDNARWALVGCYGVEDTLAMQPFDETVVAVADLFPELPARVR